MAENSVLHELDVNKYLTSEIEDVNIVLPGDFITAAQGFMHGHGTFEEDGRIYSTLVGTVERTNKLILVKPLRTNYNPQVGDIVVGRVTEISNRRWKIDINASNFAQLSLNSTYLPEQRIKTEEDELNMRNLLTENDLACCEVHSVNQDKTVNLHTRSLKYGRLENGLLVQVHNKLIRRQKHHFVKLDCGVNMIFAHNGMIWLSNIERDQPVKEESQIRRREYSADERENMAVIGNILKFLNEQQVEISIELTNELYAVVKKNGFRARDILQQKNQTFLAQILMQRIEEKIPKEIERLTRQVDFLNEM